MASAYKGNKQKNNPTAYTWKKNPTQLLVQYIQKSKKEKDKTKWQITNQSINWADTSQRTEYLITQEKFHILNDQGN